MIGDLKAHAIEYASKAFDIFPVAPYDDYPWMHGKDPKGAKTPIVSQYQATTDLDQIERWWSRWPDALIGHRLPAEHLIIDIDPRHNGTQTWKLLRDELGMEYPQTRIHVSGRNDGGGHIWYRRPAERITISKLDDWAESRGTGHKVAKADRWVCGLDLLHHTHRYTILPPSPHPDTGEPYRWHQWLDVADMPDALAALIIDDSPPPAPYVPKEYDGDSIADWFSAKFGVAEILHRHGWSLRRGTGDEDGSLWRHPTASGPISASVRNGCLFVYSPNTPFEPTEERKPKGYTPFRVFTMLDHGGDGSAAAKAARELKGPEPKAPKVDLGVTVPPLGVSSAGEVTDADDDAAPQPLDRFDLPKFPIDVLPKWMREEVAACAEAIQVPVEIPAALALTAISTAIAGKIDVDGINYRKPTNIYLCVVAPSGVGKSPVAARMLGPLQELERELLAAAQESLADAKTEAKVIEEKANAAVQMLKKDPTSDIARRAMKEAELEGALHEVPAAPRLIIDDHTPEALVKVIAEQTTNRIAVLSPEGASLFTSMTGQRYKDASAPPEVPAVYLSAWDGEPITVDRVNRAPQAIARPILTVGVLVQPVIVDRLAATPMIAQQGALARFLWVISRDNVGRRDPTRRRHAAPPSKEYADNLKELARRCLRWQHPAVYRATDEAADFFDSVDIARERRMGLGGDLDTYRPVIAKLNGYQWRLAAILAAAHDDPTSEGLTLERVKQADRLADYFLAHSIAVHRRAGLDERGSVLRSVAAYLINHAGERIDWRDFQLHMRGVVEQFAEVVPALEELVRMRWIAVEAGELDAIGNRGQANPTVEIDARLRATSDGAWS